jgi:hypothetical protein
MKVARRNCLKIVAGVSVLSALSALAFGDSAPAKVSKAAADYQDHPAAGKMCGMCRFYIAPGATSPGHGMMGGGMMMGHGMASMMPEGTCQLVEGEISPMGYCRLYTPLSG